MHTRRYRIVGNVAALVVAGAVLAGTQIPSAPPAPGQLLYLQTRSGITALDTRSGDTAYTAPHATASGSWSRLVVAGDVGQGSTLVEALDPATGRTQESVQVLGHYAVRSVARAGDQAVLVPAEGNRRHVTNAPYRPAGRATTELVVVRFDGSSPRRLNLTGNIEPEAFSTDGSTIFALDYRPASSPDRYRVRRIDVATGEISDVPSNDEEVRGDMRGIAQTQALSPDGSRLYTLYTLPGAEPKSFVHVLSLDAQTANCVDLPAPFGRDTDGMALAPSPDGAHLFVADATHRVVADVDTQQLAVVDTAPVRLDRHGTGPVSITATADAVFVARGKQVSRLDAATLTSTRTWTAGGTVTGVQAAPEPNLLYVARRDRVLEVDGRTGRTLDTMRTRDTLGIGHVGYTLPDTGITSYQCAC